MRLLGKDDVGLDMAGRRFPLVELLASVGDSLSPASLRRKQAGAAGRTSLSSPLLSNSASNKSQLNSEHTEEEANI